MRWGKDLLIGSGVVVEFDGRFEESRQADGLDVAGIEEDEERRRERRCLRAVEDGSLRRSGRRALHPGAEDELDDALLQHGLLHVVTAHILCNPIISNHFQSFPIISNHYKT